MSLKPNHVGLPNYVCFVWIVCWANKLGQSFFSLLCFQNKTKIFFEFSSFFNKIKKKVWSFHPKKKILKSAIYQLGFFFFNYINSKKIRKSEFLCEYFSSRKSCFQNKNFQKNKMWVFSEIFLIINSQKSFQKKEEVSFL